MAIDLREKYGEQIEKAFIQASKTNLVCDTNNMEFVGNKTVKVHTLTLPSEMQDYARTILAGKNNGKSLFGDTKGVGLEVEELTMTQDKSEHIYIDAMDEEESCLQAGETLSSYIQTVAQPTIDKYRYSTMVAKAGKTISIGAINDADDTELTSKAYDSIIEATENLDDNQVPEVGRVCIVSPKFYKNLKQSECVLTGDEVSAEERRQGVIAKLDGMPIIKVASAYLPANVQFIVTVPSATKAPVKYSKMEVREAGNDGDGYFLNIRLYFDAFVTKNNTKAIVVGKTTVKA